MLVSVSGICKVPGSRQQEMSTDSIELGIVQAVNEKNATPPQFTITNKVGSLTAISPPHIATG